MVLFAPLTRLALKRLRWFFATGDTRDAEILALRHQLHVLQRQINRPQFSETDRTILAMLATVFDRRRLAAVFLIVKPKTVLGWHQRLVARRWTQPPARKPGRPPTDAELRALVRRLATENLTWGYRRIHGELCRLGHSIAASSVWNILRRACRCQKLIRALFQGASTGKSMSRADQPLSPLRIPLRPEPLGDRAAVRVGGRLDPQPHAPQDLGEFELAA